MAARGGDGNARPVNREPTARRKPRLESLTSMWVEDPNVLPKVVTLAGYSVQPCAE